MFSSFVAILPWEGSLVISNPLVLDSVGPPFCMKQQLSFFYLSGPFSSASLLCSFFRLYSLWANSFASITIHLLITPKFISPTLAASQVLDLSFQLHVPQTPQHSCPNKKPRNYLNFFSYRPSLPPLNVLWQDVECGHGAPCHSEIQNCSTGSSGILFVVQNSY